MIKLVCKAKSLADGMLLIFVLTDANEATYSIEIGSNFSL